MKNIDRQRKNYQIIWRLKVYNFRLSSFNGNETKRRGRTDKKEDEEEEKTSEIIEH